MHRSFIDGQKTRYTRQQRGLTLVELLTVIAVMAILLSVAVPVIRPSLKDRKLRESARLINAYVAGVQARATELGRPVGIVLSRSLSLRYCCTVVLVPPLWDQRARLKSAAIISPVVLVVGGPTFRNPSCAA